MVPEIRPPKRPRQIIIGLLAFTLQVSAAPNEPSAHADFYIDAWGAVDARSEPNVRRAQEVFRRLAAVAEEPRDVTPTLRIINAERQPWAIALPDGAIILSRGALRICYQGVRADLGDARLAFVLGHELAHLTAKDFWHREIYLSLSGDASDPQLEKMKEIAASLSRLTKGQDWRENIKRKELKADDAGFLYASLAGYRTDLLLGNDQDDFLTYWVKQTRTYRDSIHFGPTERSAFLKNRFASIANKAALFDAGLQLAYFGRLEDAATVFENFRQSFPAHEVLNNLGYVHIELARKFMPHQLRYHFWLPSVLENAPELLSRELGEQRGLTSISATHLRKAIKYLKLSSEAHRENIAALINLATAHFLLGEYIDARAVIDKAHQQYPDSDVVTGLRALILYEHEKEIDMWPIAVKLLQTQASKDIPTAIYNLAKLYEERGRTHEADDLWKKLARLPKDIPPEYRLVACEKVEPDKRCKPEAGLKKPRQPPQILNVSIGNNIHTPGSIKALDRWRQRRVEIGDMDIILFSSPQGDRYLAIDDTIIAATIKNHTLADAKHLRERYGPPRSIVTVREKQIWSYAKSWAAVVENDKILEFWIGA